MDKNWEDQLKETMEREMETIPWDEQRSRQILHRIHTQIDSPQERRVIMRSSKKKLTALVAVAIMALGSISAVAAGQIVQFRSSTSLDDSQKTALEAQKTAEELLNADITIPEKLTDALPFQLSTNTEVEALDENGTVVGTYPELSVSYGNGEVFFNVSRQNGLGGREEESRWDVKEVYNGVEIKGSTDAYLFLPPGAKPSEEDQQAEAEGKLFISYGSSQEERQTFHYVKWEKDGITYGISDFDTYDVEALMEMAKMYIDGK